MDSPTGLEPLIAGFPTTSVDHGEKAYTWLLQFGGGGMECYKSRKSFYSSSFKQVLNFIESVMSNISPTA